MNRYVFFLRSGDRHDGGAGNAFVRFRFWYAIYEYLMIFPNLLIGFYFFCIRYFIAIFLNLFYLASLDVSMMPEPTGWSRWEVGYCTYISLIRMDHRYNSPVCTVLTSVVSMKQSAIPSLTM